MNSFFFVLPLAIHSLLVNDLDNYELLTYLRPSPKLNNKIGIPRSSLAPPLHCTA